MVPSNGFGRMKILFIQHPVLIIILLLAAAFFFLFPLRLQALEPYVYAAGIEGYYDFSRMFSLAAGELLPDFGRYHPNHPIGQALAAFAFDSLGIPALAWMRGINTLSALSVGYFLYFLCLGLRLEKFKANLAVSMFYSTHFAALATLSGEWHMPALALNVAGVWRLVIYLEERRSRFLFEATALMTLGACYHLNASFIMVYLGIMLLFVRPPWKFPIEITIAALIFFIPILLAYVVVPIYLFKLSSTSDFLNLFFVYTKLRSTPYTGMDWILIALKTFSHGFAFTYPGMHYSSVFVLSFVSLFLVLIGSFARTTLMPPFRWLFVALPFIWFFGPRIINSRPDALNGWLFIIPYLSIVIVVGWCEFSRILQPLLVAAIIIMFAWNFGHWIIPNSSKTREEVFLFDLPASVPKSTPVGFIIHQPPFLFPELWHAGSELGYRNQATFLPCCGERDHMDKLAEWIKLNKNAILVSDADFLQLENLFHAQGRHYKRLIDRTVNWPGSLTPATVYIPLRAPLQLRKRIVIWEPVKK